MTHIFARESNDTDRIVREFEAIQAEADKQKHRETALRIAREHKLPDSDADVLMSYEDPRMMRLAAKRFARDVAPSLDDYFRSSVPRPQQILTGDAVDDRDPFDAALDDGVRNIRHVSDDPVGNWQKANQYLYDTDPARRIY